MPRIRKDNTSERDKYNAQQSIIINKEAFNAIKEPQWKQLSIRKIAKDVAMFRQIVRKYVTYDKLSLRTSFLQKRLFSI